MVVPGLLCAGMCWMPTAPARWTPLAATSEYSAGSGAAMPLPGGDGCGGEWMAAQLPGWQRVLAHPADMPLIPSGLTYRYEIMTKRLTKGAAPGQAQA